MELEFTEFRPVAQKREGRRTNFNARKALYEALGDEGTDIALAADPEELASTIKDKKTLSEFVDKVKSGTLGPADGLYNALPRPAGAAAAAPLPSFEWDGGVP